MDIDRVKFIIHEGKEILYLNFSECKPDEAIEIIEESKKAIRTKPEQSVLTLTNVTNLRFDDRISDEMKRFTVHNKPYVKAGAVVGVVGLKKILFEAVLMFSKRKLHTFDTLDQAKEWLVKN
jgi:hypothetical protein